jgi:DNA polymerase-3 subunit epsilon
VAPSERERWRRWAKQILRANSAWMILDTETTGFGKQADIIEIAAVTPTGRVLFDHLIRPVGPIPPHISQITGISKAMVANAPTFAALYREALRTHLTTRKILAFNAPFDVRMVRSNIARHCDLVWQPVESACLMQAYAAYRNERFPPDHSQAGSSVIHSLEVACRQMGIPHENAHRALGDCLVSAKLLRAMARGR